MRLTNDKPEADPQRVRNDLLQHDIVTEDFGGEVLCVNVSAHTGLADKLEEAIMLQAELLELRANPDRPAEGSVVEAKRAWQRFGGNRIGTARYPARWGYLCIWCQSAGSGHC